MMITEQLLNMEMKDFYNEVCYTSGVYDELTGLYYLNARYYNPESATFITQDSWGNRMIMVHGICMRIVAEIRLLLCGFVRP